MLTGLELLRKSDRPDRYASKSIPFDESHRHLASSMQEPPCESSRRRDRRSYDRGKHLANCVPAAALNLRLCLFNHKTRARQHALTATASGNSTRRSAETILSATLESLQVLRTSQPSSEGYDKRKKLRNKDTYLRSYDLHTKATCRKHFNLDLPVLLRSPLKPPIVGEAPPELGDYGTPRLYPAMEPSLDTCLHDVPPGNATAGVPGVRRAL